MHPYISQGIAAERARDMRARAARGRQVHRQARLAGGSATTVGRHTIHVTRPWARRPGDLTARAHAQRDHADHIGEMPNRTRELTRRAA
jgi:hypothetical protein